MSQKPAGDMSRIQIDNIEDWFQIQKNFTEAIMSCLPQTHVASDGVQEAVKAHLLQVRTFPGSFIGTLNICLFVLDSGEIKLSNLQS